MSKYIPAFMIFGFWLVLPLGFMIMGYNSFMSLEFESVIQNFDTGNVLNQLIGFFQLIGIYVKTFFITIPNAPNWLNIGFLLPLKGITILVGMYSLKE